MKNQIKKDLKAMTQLISVSGSEQEAVTYVKDRLEERCDSLEITGLGNVIVRKKGKSDGPKILLSAHLDEIGFLVQNITADGFITFEKVGGFSDQLIPARKVWVQGKERKIPGVFGMRPAHLSDDTEISVATYIDIGAKTKAEVEELGIYIGSKIVFQSDFMEMANDDIVCSRGIDNKLSCSILINLIENLKADDICGEIIVAFSTLEETTLAGMVSVFNYIDPDFTIVLDTVPCGDVPDVDSQIELPVAMGNGPVMVVSQGILSGSGRYNNIHPKIRELLYLAGKNSGVSMQELSLCSKYYLTEESLAFQCGTKGIPAATLAIPRRYSHTPTEVADMNDADQTYRLLKELIKISDSVEMTFI